MTRLASWRPGKQPVAILPMALVLALHLALALWWINANVTADQHARQRYFTLTWLRAAAPPDPPPSPPPPRQISPGPVARQLAAAPASKPATAPAAEPFDQDEPPQDRAAPRQGPSDALGVNRLMEVAKRQVGAIDHELRGGKLGPLAPDPDLPIARLRGALDSAYIDRSLATVTETLRQADGVIVYRFRRGGKVWCRQSGGIGSGIERSDGAKLAGAGSAGGAGTAGTITCPGGDAGWSRL
ncbi:hypothetical protein [Massilia soli]|uniref:Uncharacterized protein n=1 Tax=Massilia soli TaxID=2792854 RepID=A0ABS7SRY7_9BURK|nr:hypothetical protein [Massilia soli]MBZ2208713.1 hypothetical protein [Massilia soli]